MIFSNMTLTIKSYGSFALFNFVQLFSNSITKIMYVLIIRYKFDLMLRHFLFNQWSIIILDFISCSNRITKRCMSNMFIFFNDRNMPLKNLWSLWGLSVNMCFGWWWPQRSHVFLHPSIVGPIWSWKSVTTWNFILTSPSLLVLVTRPLKIGISLFWVRWFDYF